MVYSEKWKILAANTASAPAFKTPSVKIIKQYLDIVKRCNLQQNKAPAITQNSKLNNAKNNGDKRRIQPPNREYIGTTYFIMYKKKNNG